MKSILNRSNLPRFLCLLSFTLTGCAMPAASTEFARYYDRKGDIANDGRVVVHRGKPGPFVQRLAGWADAPARMMPFGNKPMRHDISDETEKLVANYLAKKGLSDIYVCVNEYDPAGEWQRLKANRHISPLWKYSFGMVSLVGYTVFPEPVVCANQYNCFTNRLSINLDEPVDILNAAANANDVSTQRFPGTYAAITFVPGVSIIPRIRAMNDVVAYARDEGDWEMERGVYRKLYPRVGMEGSAMAVFLSPVWWEMPLFGLGGSAAGHLAGQYVESRRKRELAAAEQMPILSVEEPSHVIPASASGDSPMPIVSDHF